MMASDRREDLTHWGRAPLRPVEPGSPSRHSGRKGVCPVRSDRRPAHRRGVSSLDYMLVLGVILPMLVFIFRVGPRIIRLAYEMVSVMVSWPFM